MADKALTVWIVDDDQSVRWVLEKALAQAGMESRSFERAEHLLEAIGHSSPDVLITDIRMPGMDGIALLERLSRSSPDLPIIVITSRTGEKHRQRANDIGVEKYLGKPYQEIQLIKLISEVMGREFVSQ